VHSQVEFIGGTEVKDILREAGVVFGSITTAAGSLVIVDGRSSVSSDKVAAIEALVKGGADLWLFGATPESVGSLSGVLPSGLQIAPRNASGFIPSPVSWAENLRSSELYFVDVLPDDPVKFGLEVTGWEVLIRACATNWRHWGKLSEGMRTPCILRSELERKGPAPVLVKKQSGSSSFFVSTLDGIEGIARGKAAIKAIAVGAGIVHL
jgi:beta-galactosidase